jgi:SH3-like domain-containing protein
MALGMPIRARVAGVVGALIAVGATYLGGTLLSTPEVTVLREAPAESSPTPAPSPVAAAAPVVAPRLRVVRVVDGRADGVNLRAEPSLSGARLKELSGGAELELLGLDVEIRGRTWRRVRDPADGSEGWVAAELLGPAR